MNFFLCFDSISIALGCISYQQGLFQRFVDRGLTLCLRALAYTFPFCFSTQSASAPVISIYYVDTIRGNIFFYPPPPRSIDTSGETSGPPTAIDKARIHFWQQGRGPRSSMLRVQTEAMGALTGPFISGSTHAVLHLGQRPRTGTIPDRSLSTPDNLIGISLTAGSTQLVNGTVLRIPTLSSSQELQHDGSP